MNDETRKTDQMYQTIEDPALLAALSELSRSINIVSTYGKNHPAVDKAAEKTAIAMSDLFTDRKKVIIGAFNGVMTVDELTINAAGVLLKSLERRLVRLRITGLKIAKGISEQELNELIGLLSCQEADAFQSGLGQAGLSNVTSEDTLFQAVRDGQAVANSSDLSKIANMGGNGILVLEDELSDGGSGERDSGEGNGNEVHVDQIVAFLKGDMDLDENEIGEELAALAEDPSRLGQMIMESVSVRQSATELAGESLGDIVLGCLRRTYNGLRKQPSFKSTEGMADLQKSLLLLEESMLDKMRDLTGEPNPELDRQIVQSIREMDESISFEMAAMQYMDHRDAIEMSRQELQSFVQSRGAEVAQDIISDSDFPQSEWRKIVVDSNNSPAGQPQIAAGLNSLTTVFEKLENLMKSNSVDGSEVKTLFRQATVNLDDSIFSTKGKLEDLSKQLKEEEGGGTIGGHGRHMSREELLAALAEVAQELMQPLTAINASLEMMLHGYVGDVTSEQKDLLGLASNSGEHLKFLMNMLVDIVGCPENKGVDSRFHTTSEQVVLMKGA
ncbi:MAG: hypothetical protein V3V05_00580 [Pontiella sp.]